MKIKYDKIVRDFYLISHFQIDINKLGFDFWCELKFVKAIPDKLKNGYNTCFSLRPSTDHIDDEVLMKIINGVTDNPDLLEFFSDPFSKDDQRSVVEKNMKAIFFDSLNVDYSKETLALYAKNHKEEFLDLTKQYYKTGWYKKVKEYREFLMETFGASFLAIERSIYKHFGIVE